MTTAPHSPGAEPQGPQPEVVVAQAGTRLEQLQALYPVKKAAADAAAAAELKTVTDGLKLELNAAAPDAHRVTLAAVPDQAGDASGRPALRLAYSESWRVDAKKLKAEAPETYARFAKKSGSWSIRPVPAGDL